MHGGDVIKVSIVDTPERLKVALEDVTTGQSGSMIAGIAQGFGQVNFQPAASTCSITPYAFHPMYDTNRINFDRHSSLAERTQRSAKAFRFGLLAGSGMVFTPPAASTVRNDAQNFVSRSCKT